MNSNIRLNLNQGLLAKYVVHQINTFFNDDQPVVIDDVRALFPECLKRVEHCFTRINNKYFFDGEGAVFNHLNSDQYAMFLYLLCNTAYQIAGGGGLASKLFLLNKLLHGLDAFYEVELPSIFLFVHPIGTVLGRGSYSDYFLVYQRCGVGSNHGIYPTLGPYTTLRPGSSVLGQSRLEKNCTLAAESLLLDKDLGANTLYIGSPRDFIIRSMADTLPVWRR